MNTNRTTCLRAAFLGLLLGGLMWGSAGCAVHGDYRAHVGVGYDYYYYPDCNVYYYPVGGIYYWNTGGRWYSGHHVPRTYVIRESSRQSFRSPSHEPWRHHRWRSFIETSPNRQSAGKCSCCILEVPALLPCNEGTAW